MIFAKNYDGLDKQYISNCIQLAKKIPRKLTIIDIKGLEKAISLIAIEAPTEQEAIFRAKFGLEKDGRYIESSEDVLKKANLTDGITMKSADSLDEKIEIHFTPNVEFIVSLWLDDLAHDKFAQYYDCKIIK